MNKQELDEVLRLHQLWLADNPQGECANLHSADLHSADLDFSCLPLWCGGLGFIIDERIAKQLVYHVLNLMQYSHLNVDKIFKAQVYEWLKTSHLVKQHNLPIIEKEEK